ncbi:MAG: hypothetical protein IPN38_19100 [Flavobacteriales bacterium]|nr:hypothetical protein [Flavobacteriales bacterium]
MDGIVYDLMIEPGELATTQRALAVSTVPPTSTWNSRVVEYDIHRVELGQGEALHHAGQLRRTDLPASVTRIVPLMDDRSRTFKVHSPVHRAPAQLSPNLTAEASVVLRTKIMASPFAGTTR